MMVMNMAKTIVKATAMKMTFRVMDGGLGGGERGTITGPIFSLLRK
jgi:hypothetical protein